MKKPQECTNMIDIRTEIDRIDRLIISLIPSSFAQQLLSKEAS